MSGKKRAERDEKGGGLEAAEAALNLLTEPEERLCLTCLRFFRGDWDLYLDFLTGQRANEEQRRQDLPLVERLKERDQRTGFLELMLEDEVIAAAEHLDFEGLLQLWDIAMLLDPEADPFQEAERGESDLDDTELGAGPGSPSLH